MLLLSHWPFHELSKKRFTVHTN